MSTNALLALGVASNAALTGYEQGRRQAVVETDAETARKQSRAVAKQRQEAGQLALKQAGRQERLAGATEASELEVLQNKLDLQQQETTAQGQELFRKGTWNTLDSYYEDYDPRHLNQFLKDAATNPYAPQVLKDTLRVDKIDLQSEAGRVLLREAQVPEEELDALDGTVDGQIDWELVQKRFLVATQADGSQTLQDVLSFSATSGYGKQARKQQIEEMKQLADISKASRSKSGSTYKAPTSELEATKLAGARDAVEAGNPTSEQLAFIDIMDSKMEGATGFRRGQSEDAISEFYASGFDKLSFTDLRSNRKAMSLVRQVEDSYELSAADKKDLKESYQQVNAMRRAQGLSPASVGIIDSALSKVKRKLTDSAEGRQAKSAYSSLINVIRNQQFGSALTDKEIEAFNQAYGSNNDQMTVVLSGLNEIGELTRSKLEAIANLNNDVVIKARTGYTRSEINTMLDNIQRRIGFYSAVANGSTVADAARRFRTLDSGQTGAVDSHLRSAPRSTLNTPTEQPSSGDRPSLDSIFGAK